MKTLSLIAMLCATACSQKSQADQSNRSTMSSPGGGQLPAKFMLECGAPNGSEIPYGAEKGFTISVDRSANTFLLSWEKPPENRPWPIKRFGTKQIILAEDHEDRGPDNNPYDRKITYDFGSGVLHFQEVYSTIVPWNRNFSTSCKIVNNA